MEAVLFLRYLKWHFGEAVKAIVQGWGNMLWFVINYFSVGLLLRTFFAPWRRITWDYGRGFEVGRYLFILSSNIISRILGAVVRSFLIAVGLSVEILLFFSGLLLLVLWFVLPALIGGAFFYGIVLLL